MSKTLTWTLGLALLLMACAGGGGSTKTSNPSTPQPSATSPASAADPVSDRQAQSAAHLATSAALVAMLDGGPSGVTPDALRDLEPTLTYVRGPSGGPEEASVYVDSKETLGIAVMSASRTCFWIRFPADGDQTYGSGMPCTGRAALQATDAEW